MATLAAEGRVDAAQLEAPRLGAGARLHQHEPGREAAELGSQRVGQHFDRGDRVDRHAESCLARRGVGERHRAEHQPALPGPATANAQRVARSDDARQRGERVIDRAPAGREVLERRALQLLTRTEGRGERVGANGLGDIEGFHPGPRDLEHDLVGSAVDQVHRCDGRAQPLHAGLDAQPAGRQGRRLEPAVRVAHHAQEKDVAGTEHAHRCARQAESVDGDRPAQLRGSGHGRGTEKEGDQGAEESASHDGMDSRAGSPTIVAGIARIASSRADRRVCFNPDALAAPPPAFLANQSRRSRMPGYRDGRYWAPARTPGHRRGWTGCGAELGSR